MNKTTNTLLLLFLAVFILSCQNNKKVHTEVKQVNQDSLKLREIIAQKKKFFLQYWGGMTTSEFREVNKFLVSEGKLSHINEQDKYYYQVENCGTEFYPYFADGRLYEITLSASECLYKLFQEKYKLPALKKITYQEKSVWEDNPKYSPAMSYLDENNKLIRLPNAFIDSSNLAGLKDEENKGISSEMYVLQQDSISVKTSTADIIISQHLEQSQIHKPSIEYSLDKSPEMAKYRKSDEGDKMLGGLFATKQSSFINTNSRFRKVIPNTENIIYIRYISTEYKHKRKLDNDKNDEQQKLLKQKKAENEAIKEI
ncbi:hypothetical protein EKM05_09530 [Flavobacterium sp. GSP27]|uniref:hypothetical protein n=1 Tax=unclassified Flavobacterium TaxID=196869 RepID=UPI000F819F77|nr:MULTISPECIES: hypothetical protein [unclassified Flavobacterium]RTY76704.1 hypothetical protein EKL96_04245 [Flavobacterium sp. LS1R10]RTY95633.1 hypothetical protein EKL32_06415 [Flavobacterium sp. GSN2]RTZ08821.1 hypothetical protein EKM05_09530 [Flavobacterium sp. GSP27]